MVFYFTGTGNSLYVAKQIEEKQISIPQAIRGSGLSFSADRIGIVCPIYKHEMPMMVKEFKKSRIQYALCVFDSYLWKCAWRFG